MLKPFTNSSQIYEIKSMKEPTINGQSKEIRKENIGGWTLDYRFWRYPLESVEELAMDGECLHLIFCVEEVGISAC